MNTKILPDSTSEMSSLTEQASGARGSGRSVAFGNLLVPIDFSEHSKKTIEYATQLAALAGGNIKILHIFQIPEYPAAFYQGLYLEHEAIKTHLETAKREANAQLSLVAVSVMFWGPREVPSTVLPKG